MRPESEYEGGHESGPPGQWSAAPRSRKLRLLRWLPDGWALTSGDRARRVLHLTFDDGPHPEHTPPLLDLLARHGIRATFFVIGDRAQRHPDIVRRAVAEGHLLGNHSWSHPDFTRLGSAGRRDEIERTERLLQRLDGRRGHPFRPPSGALTAGLLLDGLRRRQRLAYWSYDSLDYSHRDPGELVANALRSPVRSGDVILMHDDSAHSRAMLEALIPRWQADGYAFEALPLPAAQAGADRAVQAPPTDARE